LAKGSTEVRERGKLEVLGH